MQTAVRTANAMAGARDGYIHAAPLNAHRRIGSTVYEVEVYVKKDTAETIEQKIMRLIRNDLNPASSHVKMSTPQTGWLQAHERAERSSS